MVDDKAPKPPRAGGKRDGGFRSAPSRDGAPKPRARVDPPAPAEEGERIAKRLARAGVASRREAESLIVDGRIRVNGEVLTSPAVNVSPADRIELDGQPIPAPERTRLFLFHKPAGVVTTNRDPEGRQTVFDVLPEGLPRLITVGRLDINTEGLLLLTNDGGLARVLELPSTGWVRRYRVRIHGEVDEARLKALAEGMAVEGVFYGPIEASLERRQGTNAWLNIALREGKNREVKNVMGALGLDVTRLIRVSFGPFQLGDLPEGHVQEIKGRMLRDQLGERLIAEAGADFEAEIAKPFSNKPTRREASSPPLSDKRTPRERVSRDELARAGEGGLIRKPGRPQRGDRRGGREDALDRLHTSRPERREEPKRSRASNVWMAAGARPEGKPKPEEGERRRSPPPKRPGRDGDAKSGERPFRARREEGRDGGERRFGASRPGRAEREAGRERPQNFTGDRRRDDRRAPAAEGGEQRAFRPRPFREDNSEARPPRRDRPEGERPAGASRPFKPRGAPARGARPDRDEADRPSRPRFDQPRPDRPRREGAPGEDRPKGDRPLRPKGERGARPNDRPSGDRPFRPKGERSARPNDRPTGDRPQRGGGGRPAGEGRGERPSKPRTGGPKGGPRGRPDRS
ncbi:MAG TPA: pseudouridine synthase [Mesorhizobium sp.]|jgi:23S rRNA pseudouridine2605 synthase|nr:pseudouridine synthase [Mesorhizobium sp.]